MSTCTYLMLFEASFSFTAAFIHIGTCSAMGSYRSNLRLSRAISLH